VKALAARLVSVLGPIDFAKSNSLIQKYSAKSADIPGIEIC